VNVAHVLEGSVRRSGNTIRVTAQLIDGRSDTHLWSQTYDRSFDDVFAIQDDIAARVVGELKLRLLGGRPVSARVDPRAYDLYLQAIHILNQVDDATTKQAEALLVEALDIEPNYVEAIGQLVRVYYHLSNADPATRHAYLAQSNTLIERLVRIAPGSQETQTWLGWRDLHERDDLPAAARHLELAIAADPTDLKSLRVAAQLYDALGRYDESIAIGRYVIERDPACGVCVSALAWSYRDSGRHREAANVLESILAWRQLDLHLAWSIGVAWLVAGEPAKALQYFEPIRQDAAEVGYLMALHDLGHMQEFEREFSALRDARGQRELEGIARVYAWIGDADHAFEYLELAAVDDPRVPGIIDTDLYAKIKSDPRWRELRARYGVVDKPQVGVAFNPPLPEAIRRSLEN